MSGYIVDDTKVPSILEVFDHIDCVWHLYKAAVLGQKTPKEYEDLYQVEPDFNIGIVPPVEGFELFRIEMNEYFLLAAIDHARVELSRWADYHLAGKLDARPSRFKLAGFLGKWIAKVRPIQVCLSHSQELSGNTPVMPKFLYSINASFAAVLIRSYLECENVDDEMIQDLTYRLHYREETALNLSLYAEHMELIGDKSSVVVQQNTT